MLALLRRAFGRLDTSELDREMAAAAAMHQQVRVRARALRMDVCCGDAPRVIARLLIGNNGPSQL